MHWADFVCIDSMICTVEDAMARGWALEVQGNGADGWIAVLVKGTATTGQIGPLFHRDFGDTRTSCREAAARSYRVPVSSVKVRTTSF
jgi:hypothetical protein